MNLNNKVLTLRKDLYRSAMLWKIVVKKKRQFLYTYPLYNKHEIRMISSELLNNLLIC